MNEDNLVSIGDRTTEEQRAIVTAGGKASGVVRRAKKTTKEIIDIYLSMSMGEGDPASIETIQSIAKVKGVNLSVEEAGTYQQVAKMIKGDTNAYRTIMALGNRFPKATDEGPTGNVQNQYNTMVFVTYNSKDSTDANYQELTDIASRHGELLRSKEDYYDAQIIATDNNTDE